jgi:hypothetical protein
VSLLAIDPGVAPLAWARFFGGALHSCGFMPREAFAAADWTDLHSLVIEKPFIYPKASKGDPNDLIDLAGAAYFAEGAIVARGGPRAHYVYPRDWKGQLDKPIHHERVWSMLSPPEIAAFCRDTGLTSDEVAAKIERACDLLAKGIRNKDGSPKEYAWKTHNLLDAIGLGLWRLGRVGVGARRFAPSLDEVVFPRKQS